MMIYYGQKAKEILDENLSKNARIFSKGYFKENNMWIAFDNNSGDCFVEDFTKEEIAIAWLKRYFEVSEIQDFKILKVYKGLYYMKKIGILSVKFEKHELKTKLFSTPKRIYNRLYIP